MKTKIHIVFVLLITCAFTHMGIGQMSMPSQKEFTRAGNEAFALKNYFDALYQYEHALEYAPDNALLIHKAAESARLFNAYTKAEKYYTELTKHTESSSFPMAAFWLAQMQQLQGKYSDAIASYKSFKTEHFIDDPFYIEWADKEIQACQWAIEQIQNPSPGITTERLDNSINTEFSEIAPVMLQSDLYYSSLRFIDLSNKQYPDTRISKILIAKQSKDGTEHLVSANQGTRFCAHSSFNTKRNKVFYTICKKINEEDIQCEIYQSNIAPDGTWSDPVKLPADINLENSTNTQPNIGFHSELNKEILYFVSNRPGGKGGLDLYYTVIDDEGNFSTVMNITGLNSVHDDISPFYHVPTRTLYFSSKGPLGLGGFDIYKVNDSPSGWGQIKHTGSPINSSFDDVYFSLDSAGSQAHFASNRTGTLFRDEDTEACCYDIFKADIVICNLNLHVFTLDANTQRDLIGCKVQLINITNPNIPPIEIQLDQINNYIFPIECDQEYEIIATKPGYTESKINFLSTKPGEIETITKKLYLKPFKFPLEVLTFDAELKLELLNCTVEIKNLTDTLIKPILLSNSRTHIFDSIKVIPGHTYQIIATKSNFIPDIRLITIPNNPTQKLRQEMFLGRTVFSFLPLNLYFDNDQPGRRTLDTITKLTYSQSNQAYYLRKNLFAGKCSSLGSAIDFEENKSDMELFFEKQVKGNKITFDKFLKYLEQDLQTGRKYEIILKGYASPRANNVYNKKLSQRRISSVRNEFLKYNKGSLAKYIKNNHLKISDISFGEEAAPKNVSDDLTDEVRSIYCLEPSLERRVELIEIKE